MKINYLLLVCLSMAGTLFGGKSDREALRKQAAHNLHDDKSGHAMLNLAIELVSPAIKTTLDMNSDELATAAALVEQAEKAPKYQSYHRSRYQSFIANALVARQHNARGEDPEELSRLGRACTCWESTLRVEYNSLYDWCVDRLKTLDEKGAGSWAHMLCDRYQDNDDKAAWGLLCSMGRTDGIAYEEGFAFDTEQSVKGLRSVAIKLARTHEQKEITDAATLIGCAKALPGYSEVNCTPLHSFYINFLSAYGARLKGDYKSEEMYLRMLDFGRKSAKESALVLLMVSEDRLQNLATSNQ